MVYLLLFDPLAMASDIVKMDNGLRFQHLPHLYLPTMGTKTLVFDLKVPERIQLNLPLCSQHNESIPYHCGNWPPIMQHLVDTAKQLQAEINSLYAELPALFGNHRDSTQNRRGLFDAVGQLSHSLFGTATEDEIQQIYNEIKALEENFSSSSTATWSFNEKLKKVLKDMDERFDGVHHMLEDNIATTAANSKRLAEIQSSLNTFINAEMANFVRVRSDISHIAGQQYILTALILLTAARDEARGWINSYTDLQSNKLPKYLIPDHEMLRALSVLKDKIRETNTEITISIDKEHLPMYFDSTTTTYRILNGHVLIAARIPLLTNGPAYQGYKVTTFPLPMPYHQSFTRIMLNNEILLVSRDREFYMETNTEILENCHGDKFKICPDLIKPQRMTNAGCLPAALLDYPREELRKLCPFRLYNAPIDPRVHCVGDGQFLLLNYTANAHVSCPRMPPSRLKQDVAQVISIPCGCKLVTASGESAVSTYNCQSKNITINITGSVNFAVNLTEPHIQEFVKINPALNLNKTQTLSALMKHAATVKKLDERLGLELADLAEATGVPAVMTATAMVRNEYWNWTVLVTGLWLAVITIAMVYVGYRLRVLRVLVLGLPLAKVQAAAAPITAHGSSNDFELTTELLRVGLWCLIPIALGAILFTGRALLSLIRRRTATQYRSCQWLCPPSQSSDTLDMFLKISRKGMACVVFLTATTFECGDTVIRSTPVCNQVAVLDGFPPTLHMVWDGELVVEANGHPLACTLPRRMNVSTECGRLVSRILDTASPNDIFYNVVCRTKDQGYQRIPQTIGADGWQPGVRDAPRAPLQPSAPQAPVQAYPALVNVPAIQGPPPYSERPTS